MYVFFFPPLTFVFVILVYFWTLKTVALSLFVTVLLLYTVFFAFACFYFIQKLVPQCRYYRVVWPVFLSIIYHVVHIHTLGAFLSLCSLPRPLHCQMYGLVSLFFFNLSFQGDHCTYTWVVLCWHFVQSSRVKKKCHFSYNSAGSVFSLYTCQLHVPVARTGMLVGACAAVSRHRLNLPSSS